MNQNVEAVYENGVFRPLQPVNLPENQRVTLQLPDEQSAHDAPPIKEAAEHPEEAESDDDIDLDDIEYVPLPLRDRVKIRNIGEIPLVPIDIDADELDALNNVEESE